jgi:hypothetical protein
MQLKRQPDTRFGELFECSGWFMFDANFVFLLKQKDLTVGQQCSVSLQLLAHT